MAKGRSFNINSKQYQKELLRRIEQYAFQVDRIYFSAADEYARIAGSLSAVNPAKLFSFADYPQTNDRVNKLMKDMYSKVRLVVQKGIESEWVQAAVRNDNLVAAIYKSSSLSKKQLEKYNDRNLEALQAFQNRKADGMTLSDRIWNQSQAFKSEMELGLDLGLGEGKSAQDLSRILRRNLKEPDRLFRRVRDKRGELVLSKSAAQYKPGQGKYRSSYKNAMRLTRTETNMAYRASDHARWNQMDFVVGIEIKLSNNPNHCPTCIQLAGKYPKEFKFVGWHPQCRCFAVSILKTDDEIDQDDIRILQGKEPFRGSQNMVKDVPVGFKTWAIDNLERSESAKSQPYFVRDNFKNGKIKYGLKPGIGSLKLPEPKIERNFIPTALAGYESRLGIKVDTKIFDLLNKPVELVHSDGKGAYFNTIKNIVNIPFDNSRLTSKWKAESVVYHEYGHAADWQHGLKRDPAVLALMEKYRKMFGKNRNAGYKHLDEVLWDRGTKAYMEKDYDVMHKLAATHDTLMSLNMNYGAGHTKAYFKTPGMSEAEFIAHMFENKFIGNELFREIMPGLYDDSISLANEIIARITAK